MKKLQVREIAPEDSGIVCGVAHQNELSEWFYDEVVFDNSIDLTYEEAKLDAIMETELTNEQQIQLDVLRKELTEEGTPQEDIEKQVVELGQEFFDENVEQALGNLDFSGNSYYLIGDWEKREDGKYYIQEDLPNCGFAGTFNSEDGIAIVEKSKWVAACNETSPCYMMRSGGPCGDLGTVGSENMLAYSFPADLYREED